MSTRAQMRRSVCQEEEVTEYVDPSLPRVLSSEFRRVVDNVPSTSVDENMPQDSNELESLKSSLRKEITEEKSFSCRVSKRNYTRTQVC